MKTILNIIEKDFLRKMCIANQDFVEFGSGVCVSPEPIRMEYLDNGDTRYIYQIANIFPDYLGGYVIELIAEWDDITEQMTIYKSSDIDFIEENFIVL